MLPQPLHQRRSVEHLSGQGDCVRPRRRDRNWPGVANASRRHCRHLIWSEDRRSVGKNQGEKVPGCHVQLRSTVLPSLLGTRDLPSLVAPRSGGVGQHQWSWSWLLARPVLSWLRPGSLSLVAEELKTWSPREQCQQRRREQWRQSRGRSARFSCWNRSVGALNNATVVDCSALHRC